MGNRPLNGNYTINLKLYDAAEAGAVLFEETHAGVADHRLLCR